MYLPLFDIEERLKEDLTKFVSNLNSNKSTMNDLSGLFFFEDMTLDCESDCAQGSIPYSEELGLFTDQIEGHFEFFIFQEKGIFYHSPS